jgi:SnoaL-like protein
VTREWPKAEIEAAFRTYFLTGPVHEDWARWAELFTEEATYSDHFWGVFTGPSEIGRYVAATMSAAPQVYTPLLWYSVGDERVVYEVLNRADNPVAGGPPIEFPSLQVLTYAGDGRWDSQRDWWSMHDMKRMGSEWAAALAEAGKPADYQPLSRKDWGPWIDWARPVEPHTAQPSWLGSDIKPVSRLRDLDFGRRNS